MSMQMGLQKHFQEIESEVHSEVNPDFTSRSRPNQTLHSLPFFPGLLALLNTVMYHFMTGRNSEKFIIRPSCHCVNITEYIIQT